MRYIKFFRNLVIFACAYSVILYLTQEHFYLNPDKEYISPKDCNMPLFDEVIIKTDDNISIMNWYAKGDKDKPVILFFHGNRAQIAEFAPSLRPYIENGFSIMLSEYRGFGASEGSFTQENMYKDAEKVYDYIKHNLNHKDIFVLGYSLGTAPASYLAKEKKPKGVILLAPFYSLKEIAGEKYIPLAKYIIKYDMPSYKYIKKYTGPLLIVHGKDDMLIPAHHGKNLYNISQSSQRKLIILPKLAHNTLFFKSNEGHSHVIKWIQETL